MHNQLQRKSAKNIKKLREALAKKKKYKVPGEIVTVETVKKLHGDVKVPVSIEKPKGPDKEAAKKIVKKYDKIRREKKFEELVDVNETKKKRKTLKQQTK